MSLLKRIQDRDCKVGIIGLGYVGLPLAAELAKATRKHGGIETFRRQDVSYVVRIGEIVAGGREAHRRDPILVGYAEARTPLCLDAVMADVMLAHLELGLPQSLDTMPSAGASAPMSAAAKEKFSSPVFIKVYDADGIAGYLVDLPRSP